MAKKLKKQTYIALVLDESGSMNSMRDAAIELFNAQADVVRKSGKKAGETRVTFVKFGANPPKQITEVFHAKGADELPTLTRQNYVPQAGTPMRDGIGLAISRLEAEDDGGKDTAFLVIVVTDGHENSSREWTAERLRTKVGELQATGRWTFAVYGSNITLADLHDVGFTEQSLPAANFGAYKPDAAGLRSASLCMASASSGYLGSRAAGVTASVSFVADVDGKKEK